MKELMIAVAKYNLALSAWQQHTDTYYTRYQVDEPMTPGERRADEELYRREKRLRDVLRDTQNELIAAARRFYTETKSEQS